MNPKHTILKVEGTWVLVRKTVGFSPHTIPEAYSSQQAALRAALHPERIGKVNVRRSE